MNEYIKKKFIYINSSYRIYPLKKKNEKKRKKLFKKKL